MISAHRAGMAAGNTIAQQHPGLTLNTQKTVAQEEIARRKRIGIAHFTPEEEFIRGFLDGYQAPLTLTDGLTLASNSTGREPFRPL